MVITINMNNKILITQSNYIPWKGYFDSIKLTDTFVVYDDMQYTRRDWRNRNLIKTNSGLKWLTIPVQVKGKYFQKINETLVSDSNWNIDHLNILNENYKSAKSYLEAKDFINDLYRNVKSNYLTEINVYFITEICKFLQIPINIRYSSEFVLQEDRNERLISIVKDLDGKEYYSGPAAKFYMDEELFNNSNIQVHYLDYSNYPEYDQKYGDFEHGVSIIDLIYNEGQNAKNFLKY
jgi:hypothetical protein